MAGSFLQGHEKGAGIHRVLGPRTLPLFIKKASGLRVVGYWVLISGTKHVASRYFLVQELIIRSTSVTSYVTSDGLTFMTFVH